MKIHDAFLVPLILLNGCVSRDVDYSVDREITTSFSKSVCKLSTDGLAEGLSARVVALYKTDKSHYEYLFSDGCGKDGVMNVGNLKSGNEVSVKRFFYSVDEQCTNQNAPYLCVVEARIDAEIEIRRDQDGKHSAELLKVYGFSFVGAP